MRGGDVLLDGLGEANQARVSVEVLFRKQLRIEHKRNSQKSDRCCADDQCVQRKGPSIKMHIIIVFALFRGPSRFNLGGRSLIFTTSINKLQRIANTGVKKFDGRRWANCDGIAGPVAAGALSLSKGWRWQITWYSSAEIYVNTNSGTAEDQSGVLAHT
jgi:hypothetical protein